MNNGAKNKLGLTLDEIKSLNSNTTSYQWNGNSCTTFGATFTFNDDGTISVSGTGGSSVPVLHICNFVIPETDEYVISGCPTGGIWNNDGGSGDTYRTRIGNASDAYVGADFGEGFSKSYTKGDIVHLQLNIARGYTLPSGFKFSPMICTKAQFNISPTYEPYALGNQYLTPELIELVDSGAKNVWDFANANFGRDGQCTYTKTNTSITVLSNNSGWSYVSYALPLKAGSYVLSGVLSNVTIPTGSLPMIRVATSSNGDGALQTVDIGGKAAYELKFTAPSDATYYVIFAANWQNPAYVAGYTISNIMVCTKAAFSVSPKFVPYRPNYDLVVSDVAKTQYVIQTASYKASASNTYEYTGLSITVPANHIYEIHAYDYYSGVPVSAICIADTNSSITSNAVIMAESAYAISTNVPMGARSVSCISAKINISKTYYLWVKHEAATVSNEIGLMYRVIL